MADKPPHKLSLATLISASQKEVISQLTLLDRILKDCHVVDETTHKVVDLIDSARRAENEILIRAEKDKVANLQLTLAFVGTMKAGKSMTINAITGARLLPSRDSAMTALPTIVTHKHKQKEPTLRLSRPKPFNDAIERIREEVNKRDGKTRDPLSVHPDLDATLKKIRDGKFTIKKEYIGESEIYGALVCLNDIVRLAVRYFDLPSPVENYRGFGEFPHIEIEFSYLKDRTSTYGGMLSLVDTPGPNEVGGKLRDLVISQLKQASTVISLLDYTNLESVADNEMRQDIRAVQDIVGSKLFVLLNKFDQKTESGGLSREKAIDFIYTQLFPDRQSADGETLSVKGRVFPASSKKAFYANLARRAISLHGRLPEPAGNDWVIDFAQLAFGTLAAKLTVDPSGDFHREGSDNLWNESELEAPLEEIIIHSLDQSVPVILQAALSKIRSITRGLREELDLVEKSHTKGLNELQEVIAKMRKRLEKIERLRVEVEAKKAQILNVLSGRIKDRLKKWQEETSEELPALLGEIIRKVPKKDSLDEIFEKSKRGKRVSRIAFRLVAETLLEVVKASGNVETALSALSEAQRQKGLATIKFDKEEEAMAFKARVLPLISQFIQTDLQAHLHDLQDVVKSAQDSMSDTLKKQVLPIIEAEMEELKETFDLSIKIPLPKFENITLDLETIMSEMVKTSSEKVDHYTYKRRWYTLWLWEHEEVIYKTEERYVIETKQFEESMSNAIGRLRTSVEAEVKKYISGIFSKHLDTFFSTINSAFDRIQKNIETAIDIRNHSILFQHVIIEKIIQVSGEARELAARTKDTQNGLEEYFKSPPAR